VRERGSRLKVMSLSLSLLQRSEREEQHAAEMLIIKKDPTHTQQSRAAK
jgi:hypothetical protein